MMSTQSVVDPACEVRARRQVPYFRHGIGEEEIRAVCETLRSDWLTSGPRVKQFETDFSAFVEAPFAIAVTSGTAALRLAMEALGIGPGDEVLVPTMTFASAIAVVLHLGARPVFVDCTPDTLTMDPVDLQHKITANSRVVMPMHYAGHPCDLDAVHEIATAHHLRVVEDAAHAVTAAYKGKPIGSTSETSCFSFYANKTMTTGEGGMITTLNPDLAARMRLMTYHGINRNLLTSTGLKRWWRYEVVAPGFKDNLTDIQAAIGVEQLKKAHAFRNARQRCADLYREALDRVPGVRLPVSLPVVRHAWHMHVIQLQPDELAISRDEFSLRLEEEGVANSVHYLPLHLHKYYQEAFNCQPTDCPVATAAYDRILSLPIFPGLEEDDVAYVAEQVRKLCLRYRR
jgi:perosamine synthetase